jgi:hypothetical protein
MKPILRMIVKLTSAGNIKVAKRFCNRNLIIIQANNTNYTNKPIGA